MENEPEVTREQMDETRTSLSEKLETLEQHMVDTMQGATTAVADTVENIKDAVQDTVDSVKDAFNLHLQVKRHPWGMVGGSIALGCLGGYLLFRNRSDSPRANGWSPPASPDSPRITKQQNGVVRRLRSVEEAFGRKSVPEVSQDHSETGWLSWVNNLFGTEITTLKRLAIGTALSVVRDVITQSVSEPMKAKLARVMDSVTVKLGGEPIRAAVYKDGACANGEEHQEGNSAATG